MAWRIGGKTLREWFGGGSEASVDTPEQAPKGPESLRVRRYFRGSMINVMQGDTRIARATYVDELDTEPEIYIERRDGREEHRVQCEAEGGYTAPVRIGRTEREALDMLMEEVAVVRAGFAEEAEEERRIEEERERARLEAQRRREEAKRAEAEHEAKRLRLDLGGNPIDCENAIQALLEGAPGSQWRLPWQLREKGPVEPGTRLEFERGAHGREAAESVSIRFAEVRDVADLPAIAFLIDGEEEVRLVYLRDFVGYDRMTVHGGEVDAEAAEHIAAVGDLEGEIEPPTSLEPGAPLYMRSAFLQAHIAGLRAGRGKFMLNGRRVFFDSLEDGRLQYTKTKSQKRPDTVDFTKDRLGVHVSSDDGGRLQGGLRRIEYDGRSRRMGTTVPVESAEELATALYGAKEEAVERGEETQIYADTTGWEALPPYSSEGDILRVCDTVGRGGLLEIDGVVARLRGYRPGTTRVTVEYIVGKETPVDLRNCTVRYAPGLEEQVVAEKVENDEAAPVPSTPAAVVVGPPEEEVAQPKRLEKGASREEVEEFFKGLIPGAVTLRIDGGALTAEYRGMQGRSGVILYAGSEFVWPISEHSFEVVEVTDEEEMMPEPVPARTQPTSGRRRIKTSAVARSAAASPSSGVERPSIRRRSGPAHWGSSVDLKKVDARLGRSGNDEKK